MVIQDLQRFLESQVPGACVPVDLLKIAKSVSIRRGNQRNVPRGGYGQPPLTLVVDGECCLDRLYGGFFSDWVCGGQWNRMVQFLAVLIQTVQSNNIELAVFFNGALEQQRLNEWSRSQIALRRNVNSVLKHVTVKGTPPPKVWWVAPVGLRTCLRMALRHLNIQVLCTMDDHHQEVIAFCRENNYHGLMAEDAEYIIFDPPRYFSSHQLKLTYKGSLETKEFILDEVARGLGLQRNYFCLLAALLGNYLLTESDLRDFYAALVPNYDRQQTPQEEVIRAVVKFIVNRCDVNNLLSVGAQIFGSISDPRVAKFKESVQYFLNGTKDGFLRYKPFQSGRRDGGHRQSPHQSVPKQEVQESKIVIEVTGPGSPQGSSRGGSGCGSLSPEAAQLEQALESRLGGFTIVVTGEDDEETQHLEDWGGEAGRGGGGMEDGGGTSRGESECDGGGGGGGKEDSGRDRGENIKEIFKGIEQNKREEEEVEENGDDNKEKEKDEERKGDLTVQPADLDDHDHDSGGGCLGSTASGSPGASLLLSSSSSSSNSSAASPYRLTPDVSWAAQVYRSNHTSHSSSPSESHQEPGPQIDPNPLPLPPVPHEVMRTGLRTPPEGSHVSLGVPGPHTEGLATEVPEIKVREWVYTKNNPYRTADIVEATPINWAVPTVQRLWFGSVVDDKKRRLRAFLSCMRSDSPLMLHTSHVPQHLLIMATVLRYIMSNPTGPVLRKQELDAFLVTAFSPDLTNAHYLQDLQLPLVTARGAQLAALFMLGVETALFANDACGAPVPWLMCCPWLYFDGKLFHAKLIRANCARSLVEVCDGEIDLVAKVERCRQAILEGIRVEFAHPLLPPMPGAGGHKVGPPPPYPMAHPPGRGRGRGGPVRNSVQGGGVGRMFSRGGQLQVAGVVVGSWGPNYGSSGNDYRPRGTRYPHNGGGNMQGRSESSRFSRSTRGRPTVLAKRRTIKKREIRSSRGRGMSMEAPGNRWGVPQSSRSARFVKVLSLRR
ncbi:constitutive coactivator of PPAR-gamma-like protein 2 isoform X2 [Penaeus chinensis]|uniref:constitutive coactivator of PPAR-gamma-like protein 2 isoform X2 n=1 Tax=Penaeus chinensis TaxID=139456 RepID=UPI001FB81D20|nr:constitutive coactivator of PPAR-gamma-like protein 2 isoform X2 [Penaeus chinensis]